MNKMKQRELYAMLETSLNEFLKTSADIMTAKNGMTAEDMRISIEDIYASTDLSLTPETREDYDNLYKTSDNGTAHINIKGMLTPKANPCAAFFGEAETEYGYIKAAIEKANADPMVKSIQLDTDSPGGYVDGVDRAAEAVAMSEKPTVAMVENLAASAAYWIISQADTITAKYKTALIGSIGVLVEAVDFTEANEKKGVKSYVLTSTDAPNKHTDIKTEKGQAQIIDRLNDIHNVFASRVASGRGITIEKVNSDFGRGGILIAENALKAGMIDIISDYEKNKSQLNNSALPDKNKSQEVDMDFKSYLKENPEAMAEYTASLGTAKTEGIADGKTLGIAEGIKAESERQSSIFALSGLPVSEPIKAALADPKATAGSYAIAERTAQINVTAKEPQDLGSFTPESNTPKDTAVKSGSDFWDKAYDKKKEGK